MSRLYAKEKSINKRFVFHRESFTMKPSLRKHRDWLSVLAKSKRKQRVSLLERAEKPHIHTLGECCHNLLKGNLKLSPALKKKLGKYKGLLRKIGCPDINWKSKRQLLVQTGGAFLPLLLGPIISGISGLIGSLFNK